MMIEASAVNPRRSKNVHDAGMQSRKNCSGLHACVCESTHTSVSCITVEAETARLKINFCILGL